jgi:uncharacterized protein (TIGR00266 family)
VDWVTGILTIKNQNNFARHRMQVDIRNRPSFANLRVQLGAGDRIIAEAGAMATMSSNLEMKTRFNGGFFGGIARRFLGNESIFVNEFSASSPAELVLTQPFPGDMVCTELRGNTLYLQPGAFIACEPGVRMSLGWAGARSWIAGEGLFRLKLSGSGRLWFGAYGAIFDREISGEHIVDSGHLVAYEPTISINVGMAGGIFTSFFSGEGLVTRVRGQGKIYMQSRSFDGLAAWTNSHLM